MVDDGVVADWFGSSIDVFGDDLACGPGAPEAAQARKVAVTDREIQRRPTA